MMLLMSNKRNKKLVIPRQMAIYLSKKLTDSSTPEIGDEFNRDHTTILNSIKRIEHLFKDNNIHNDYLKLYEQLKHLSDER